MKFLKELIIGTVCWNCKKKLHCLSYQANKKNYGKNYGTVTICTEKVK